MIYRSVKQPVQLRQTLSNLRHITECTCIAPILVIQHSSVEFLIGAAAFSPLKVLHGIRAMGNRLHRREHVHPRPLYRIVLSPVDHRRRTLHEQERLLFHTPHHAVVKRRLNRHGNFVFLLMPERIVIP